MSQIELAGFLILILFLLLGSGLWIGMALLGVGWVAMALFTTRPVGDAMVTTIWGSSSSWTLTALPLFIWMGEILFRSKLSENMFHGLAPWLSALPGRLLHTNVVGCAPDAVRIGMRVEVVFEDVTPEITLPKFRPA